MAHDPITDRERMTTAPTWARRQARWTKALQVATGVLALLLGALALESRYGSSIVADAALAQEVASTAVELAAETAERMEGDEQIADEVEVVKLRVGDLEQICAAQAAHSAAIDAQLADIKSGQAQQLKILIQIAQDR
jgi:hypothetical protein